MKKKIYSKVIAVLLCVMMLVGIMPLAVLASSFDTSATGDYYTIISEKEYVLCDGAKESEIVLNNATGSRRQILHVIEVDPNNTNVEVLPSYYAIDKDLTNPSNWSAQIMEKQMDYYRDELGYNVVGGMNTALAYDTEAPYGLMVHNGKVLADGTVHPGAQTYLAVIKKEDGTVYFELRSVSDGLKGDEWQAISANFGFVIKNGELVAKTPERTSAAADRSMIGIKSDGTLVICQAEGRNAPYAVGLSSYEIGEAMLALGCVWAVNGDGGGSSQFLTKREGEDDYSLRNIPSDGTPRATINGIVVTSKAAPSGIFDHVSMIAKSQYITPGSSVEIEIKGVDASGSTAEIPKEGLVFKASSGVYVDGIYTADEIPGKKSITAYYNDIEVGSVSVDVVIPTSLEFISSEMVIPYGKSNVDLGLIAYYGNFEVPLETKDITIELDNNTIGFIDGFGFTSVDEKTELENTNSNITATLVYDKEIVAAATISLGKGSEVLYDFEDCDLHGWYRGTTKNYNYNNPAGDTSIVNSNSGKVHGGNYAMAVEVDFSNSLEAGFQLGSLIVGEDIVLDNATQIGMWIYIPDEAYGLRIDSGITGFTGNWAISGAGEAKVTEVGFVYGFDESGWYYISKDISSKDSLIIPADTQLLKFYVSQKDGKNEYYYGDQSSVNGRYIFYVDDITVDYSSAVDDREAPIFGSMSYATPGMDESVTLVKDTSSSYSPTVITSDTVSFIASVSENTMKSNYTGVDTSSGRAYIDGVDFSDKIVWTGNSKMSLNDITLSDGRHEIKFTVCDRQGNYTSVIRDIIVNSTDDAPVRVVAHNPDADRILLGSLYYVDVIVSEIDKVESVKTTLDLYNISTWELDHIMVARGFNVTYSLSSDENIAEITITRCGVNNQIGEQALISIPIRTWQLAPTIAIYGHAGKVWMYPDYKKGNEILPIDLSVEVDAGLVIYTNGTMDSFSSPRIQVNTEMSGNAYTSSGSAANNYIRNEEWYASWNGGHDHRIETAQYYAQGATNVVTPILLPDKEATGTEDGYIGRTYCEVCESVVDWGETIPATGHYYNVVGNKLICDCGEVISSTGIVENDEVTYYLIAGTLQTGWQFVDNDWYYFTSSYSAVEGNHTISGVPYKFDDSGRLSTGTWVHNEQGYRYYYGPSPSKGWTTIDDKLYYFTWKGYRVSGYVEVAGAIGNVPEWCYFDENGVFIEYMDGVMEYQGKLYYFDNGTRLKAGVVKAEAENEYYYFGMNYYALPDGQYYIPQSMTNGYIDAGVYEIKNYKIIIPEPKNGIVSENGKLYYYENNERVQKGLVKDENGDYYYFGLSYYAVKNGTYYFPDDKMNGLLEKGGNFTVDAEGKVIIPEPKNGIVSENGKLYYYENNERVQKGLVKDENGDYYYFGLSYYAVKNGTYYFPDDKMNGLLEKGGNFTVDAEGRVNISN